MSKRTDYDNGGFITPSPEKSEILLLVEHLKDMVLKLGELLLASPPPKEK